MAYPRRLLVAWSQFSVNGGIGRFINVARTLSPFGVEVCFTSISNETQTEWPDFPRPVLTFREAAEQAWDAVMVPGAGGRDETLALLAQLKDRRFGTRVQHVLSDPSRLQRFVVANRAFEPDLVLFNNSQWSPPFPTELHARRLEVLPGAVDTDTYYPLPIERRSEDGMVIGAYAAKNVRPILRALAALPASFSACLYGPEPEDLDQSIAELGLNQRVSSKGPLFGAGLANFYRSCDAVVTTELVAGWCNTAAEAMACGVPVICSHHGTVDFAQHQKTALVLSEVSPETIAGALSRLREDANFTRRLAVGGARLMRSFTWAKYAGRMLEIIAGLGPPREH